MAMQKKSLIGKSTAKKATSAMPAVSQKPGMTRLAHTKISPTRIRTRVGVTHVAATRVRPTRLRTK